MIQDKKGAMEQLKYCLDNNKTFINELNFAIT